MPLFAVLITHREVFGREPSLEDLRSLLGRYRRRDVIAFLSMLNCLLGTWRNSPEKELDIAISNALLQDYRERLNAIRNVPLDRLIFSRLTLLYLVKQACIACPDEGAALTTSTARTELAICCLMANDLVLPFVPERSNTIIEKLSNILPFSDYVSLDHYPAEIGRVQVMLEEILQTPQIRNRPDFLDLSQLFQQHFNISPRTFLEMVFGCATRFLQVTPDKLNSSPDALLLRDTYFQKSELAPEAIALFFRKFVLPEPEFARRIRESQNRPGDDLTVLQQFPIIEMTPGIYTCLDAGFLMEKAGRGFYWVLFSEADADLKRKLPGFWGAVFEAYVNSILQQSCGTMGRFIPEPKFANGDRSFDACILEDHDLLVFEHKSSAIRADAKYGGDVSKLENELRRKFVEGEEGEAKGVSQLSRNLSRFLGGELLEGLDARDILRVYPILVCLENAVNVPYMARYFREKFDEIYQRKKYRQVVTPLFTLGISDVENLLGYLGSFRFSAILESYYAKNKSMMATISNAVVPLLKNVPPGNNLVKERFSLFTERLVKTFFGEGATLAEEAEASSGDHPATT